MKPLVSVVIITYNREAPLRRAISSVLRQSYPHIETIVVDQTKQHEPATTSVLTSVQVVHQDEPHITKARNAGLKRAQGGIILYIDDDVEVPENFIEEHVKNYNHPRVASVTGTIIESTPQQPARISRDQLKDWWHITFRHEKEGPIARVAGGNMSFRTELLREIGGFDENFSGVAWGEETDVSFRLRARGHTLWFDPQAQVTHFSAPQGGTRTDQPDITLNKSLYENQGYFFRKHLLWHELPRYLILSYRFFVLRKPAWGKFLRRNRLFMGGLFAGWRRARRA